MFLKSVDTLRHTRFLEIPDLHYNFFWQSKFKIPRKSGAIFNLQVALSINQIFARIESLVFFWYTAGPVSNNRTNSYEGSYKG